MSDTLLLDHLAYWEEIAPFNCQLAPGTMAVILTPKDEYNSALARLLLGLSVPQGGTIRLFGLEPGRLNEREKCELRQRIGLVAAGGGLIANLKVWENLLLPAQYHRRAAGATLDAAAREALLRVGYTGSEQALPGLINHFQRVQTSLARALLLDPELMLYEALHFGLNQRERQLLLDVTRLFHHERAGRTSLFLTSDPTWSCLIPEAEVYSLSNGGVR